MSTKDDERSAGPSSVRTDFLCKKMRKLSIQPGTLWSELSSKQLILVHSTWGSSFLFFYLITKHGIQNVFFFLIY